MSSEQPRKGSDGRMQRVYTRLFDVCCISRRCGRPSLDVQETFTEKPLSRDRRFFCLVNISAGITITKETTLALHAFPIDSATQFFLTGKITPWPV